MNDDNNNVETSLVGAFAGLEKAAEAKTVTCPYCASIDTEIYALFGKQLSTMQYYCKNCHTPFEYVKGDDALSGVVRGG